MVSENTAKREASLDSKKKFLYFIIPSSFTPRSTALMGWLSNDMALFEARLPDKSGTILEVFKQFLL